MIRHDTSWEEQKTGAYTLSFDEFKNDAPSHTDFKVDFRRLTDELFIKQPDGNYSLSRVNWDFFDGEVLFIRIRDNYFPVDEDGSVLNFFAASTLVPPPIADCV